jgi:hypothetical protein
MTDVSSGNGLDLVPTEISYDNSDVERDLRRPRLRAGETYRGRITEAKTGAWPQGNLFLELTFAPVDTAGNARMPTANYRLDVPFKNPNKPDAPIPEIWKAHNFLTALYPEKFPANPTWNKGDGSFTTADGQVVSKSEAEVIKTQNTKAVRDQMVAYWRAPNELVGEVAFIVIKDDEYRNVKKVLPAPLPGTEARYTDLADTQ